MNKSCQIKNWNCRTLFFQNSQNEKSEILKLHGGFCKKGRKPWIQIPITRCTLINNEKDIYEFRDLEIAGISNGTFLLVRYGYLRIDLNDFTFKASYYGLPTLPLEMSDT